MDETLLTGVVQIIYKPNQLNRGFNDIEDYFFAIKDFETKNMIKCSGKSYELYKGQKVTLTGRLNAKGIFVFSKVESKMDSIGNTKEFIEKILTKSVIEKLKKEKCSEKEISKAVVNKDLSFFIDYLPEEKAKKIINKIEAKEKFINAYDKLSKYGLSIKQIIKLTKVENFNLTQIEEAIAKNPFQLMRYGIHFNYCDIVNANNNNSYRTKGRIFGAIYEVFDEIYDSGDTYVPEEELDRFFQRASAMLNNTKTIYNVDKWEDISIKTIEKAFYELIERKKVVKDGSLFYKTEIFEMEDFLRKWTKSIIELPEDNTYSVDKINSYIKSYEDSKGFCLGKEQKEAVVNSLRHKVSIITGGAGTGKTSSLATIVSFFLKNGFEQKSIRLSSPTGKASQRMMESINGQLGSQLVATTCHVMLEARGNSIDSFQRNENNKLEGKVLVIDETSMMDLELAYALIKAIKEDMRIIFLGDIDQLPPVKAGYFLRDMIESGIPCVKLFEIHRQKGDSSIIPVSLEIKKEQDEIDQKFLGIKKDFYYIRAELNPNHDEKVDEKNMDWLINKFYSTYERRFNEEKQLNPNTEDYLLREKVLDEIMVVTPFRDSSSNKVFNAQTISNKVQAKILGVDENNSITKNGYRFQVGSKVIISKNNNEKGLINGQIGYIRDIDFENKTFLIYSDGKNYLLNSDDIQNLYLAYAITVHKSQGSEWKLVIYCCFKEGNLMNTRNLAYTAVTRAKKYLIIYGDDTSVFTTTPKKFGTRKRSRLLN